MDVPCEINYVLIAEMCCGLFSKDTYNIMNCESDESKQTVQP